MNVKTEIKRYMKKEIDLSHQNTKTAEQEAKDAMAKFTEMARGYNINMSHFKEITQQYNNVLRQLKQARNAYIFNKLKEVTARLELVTEDLKQHMKTFRVRHRRLIQEAAAQNSTMNVDSAIESDE